jgi:hypothetical protein
MPFIPSVHRVRKDTKEVERLIEQASRIYAMSEPPAGAAGCEDCKRLDELVRMVG